MSGYRVKVNGKYLDEMTPEERAAHDRRSASRLRDMLSSGRPPRAVTDDTFLAKFGANGRQFVGQEQVGDYYREVAEEKGQSTKGKVYLSSLAAFPGDPRAWVDGRADIQRVCEERGWNCEGTVNVKAPTDVAPPKEVVLAEDIVQAEVDKRLEVNPEQRVEDVREKVISDRKPHWAKT